MISKRVKVYKKSSQLLVTAAALSTVLLAGTQVGKADTTDDATPPVKKTSTDTSTTGKSVVLKTTSQAPSADSATTSSATAVSNQQKNPTSASPDTNSSTATVVASKTATSQAPASQAPAKSATASTQKETAEDSSKTAASIAPVSAAPASDQKKTIKETSQSTTNARSISVPAKKGNATVSNKVTVNATATKLKVSSAPASVQKHAQPINFIADAANYTVASTKTVGETINYVTDTGKVFAPQYTASPITIVVIHDDTNNSDKSYYSTTETTATPDATTGIPTGNWTTSAAFGAVPNPDETYNAAGPYHVTSNDAPSSDLTKVAAQPITADSSDATYTVVYGPNLTISNPKAIHLTINYVDADGNVLAPQFTDHPITFLTFNNSYDNSSTVYHSTTQTTATIDMATGSLSQSNEWFDFGSTGFGSYNIPAITGYHVVSNNGPVGSNSSTIGYQDVTAASNDITYNVVYAKDVPGLPATARYAVTGYKTVHEYVKYVDAAGNEVAPEKSPDPITYAIIHDNTNNTDMYYNSTTETTVASLDSTYGTPTGDWHQGIIQFDAVFNPTEVPGYHVVSNNAPNSDLTEVSLQPAPANGTDTTFTVTYAPNFAITTTKTIHETINYVDAAGKVVAPQVNAPAITYITVHNNVDNTDSSYRSTTATTSTLDPTTGFLSSDFEYGDTQFDQVVNPTVTGFHVISNDAPDSDLTIVNAQTVSATSNDATYRVVYAPDAATEPNYTITGYKTINEYVNYVDENGKTFAPSQSATPVTYVTVHDKAGNVDRNFYSTTATTATLDKNGIPNETADWSQGTTKFNAVFKPEIAGYHVIKNDAPTSSSSTNLLLSAVGVQPVLPTSGDTTYTVTYAPNFKITDTKTINETINYVAAKDKVISSQYKAPAITFITVHNNVNDTDASYHSTTATASSLDLTTGLLSSDFVHGDAQFVSVNNPNVPYYHVISNNAPDSSSLFVQVQTVTADSTDATYTVVYGTNPTITNTNTIHETVNYVAGTGADTIVVAPQQSATPVTYITVHDLNSGTDTYYYSTTATTATLDPTTSIPTGDWIKGTTSFNAVFNPTEVSGYHVINNDAPNSPLTEVTVQPVQPTDKDTAYTVSYAPNYAITSTKTVNETINYKDGNGKEMATQYKAPTITYITVHDNVNKTDAYFHSTTATTSSLDLATGTLSKDFTVGYTEFKLVGNPEVAGYHVISNDAPNSNVTTVNPQTVTIDSADATYNVVYAPNYMTTKTKTLHETVNYVDGNGKAVAPQKNAQPITYATVHNAVNNTDTSYFSKTMTTAKIDATTGIPSGDWQTGTANFDIIPNPDVTGYHLISNDAPGSTLAFVGPQTVTANSEDATYTVVYAPDPTITSTKTIHETINYVAGSGATVATQVNAQPITYVLVHDAANNKDSIYYSTTATTAALDLMTAVPKGDWHLGTTAFSAVNNPEITGYRVISNNAPSSDLKTVSAQATTNTSEDATYTVVYQENPTVKASGKISETINYVDNGKNVLAPSVVGTIQYLIVHDPAKNVDVVYYATKAANNTIDPVTGIPTDSNWNTNPAQFGAVVNPQVAGYHVISNDAPNSSLTAVAAQSITANTNDATYTVVYEPVYAITSSKIVHEAINYVDGNGKTMAPTASAKFNFVLVHDAVKKTDTGYYSTTAATATLNSVTGIPNGDWHAGATQFAAVDNPKVAGYHVISYNAPSSSLSAVSAQPVTVNSTDKNYTVIYAATRPVPATPAQPDKPNVTTPTVPTTPAQPVKPNVTTPIVPTAPDQPAKSNVTTTTVPTTPAQPDEPSVVPTLVTTATPVQPDTLTKQPTKFTGTTPTVATPANKFGVAKRPDVISPVTPKTKAKTPAKKLQKGSTNTTAARHLTKQSVKQSKVFPVKVASQAAKITVNTQSASTVKKSALLPQTNDQKNVSLSVLGLSLLFFTGLLGGARRKH